MDAIELAAKRWSHTKRSCLLGVIGLILTAATSFAAFVLILSPIAATDANARAVADAWQAKGFVALAVLLPLFLVTNFFLFRSLILAVKGMCSADAEQLHHPWLFVAVVNVAALLSQLFAASILVG